MMWSFGLCVNDIDMLCFWRLRPLPPDRIASGDWELCLQPLLSLVTGSFALIRPPLRFNDLEAV